MKAKPVIGITSTTTKPTTAIGTLGASSSSSNKIDITKLTTAKDTNDPIHANANKAPGQLEDQPKTAEPKGTSGQLTIKHDFSGLSSSMFAAYKYGLSERGLANEIWGIPVSDEDMSNPDDQGQAPRIPIVLQDGDLDPNVQPAVEPQIDRQDHSTLVFHEDPEDEQLQRQAELVKQAELDRQADEEEAKAEEAKAEANRIIQENGLQKWMNEQDYREKAEKQYQMQQHKQKKMKQIENDNQK